MSDFNMCSNVWRDIRSLQTYGACLAEFIGTFILVFGGCSVCTGNWQDLDPVTNQSHPTKVQIALTFGLLVATAVWCFGHISGHINPAVTLAMLVTRKITVFKAVLFVGAQIAGAICGAGVLSAIHPKAQGTLGCTLVSKDVSGGQAVLVELLITFILVLTVFAACDKGREDVAGFAPLAIGLTVTACHLFAIKYTGSSMNPARSVGPAVIMGVWRNHWVYWVGPLIGGIIAGFLYDLVFAIDASRYKFKVLVLPNSQQEDVPRSDSGQIWAVKNKQSG